VLWYSMLPFVWHRKHLVLEQCAEEHKVPCDSNLKTGFMVHKSESTNCVLRPSRKGLSFSDNNKYIVQVLINCVDKNKANFTVKD